MLLFRRQGSEPTYKASILPSVQDQLKQSLSHTSAKQYILGIWTRQDIQGGIIEQSGQLCKNMAPWKL